jgi:hypothetical protein
MIKVSLMTVAAAIAFAAMTVTFTTPTSTVAQKPRGSPAEKPIARPVPKPIDTGIKFVRQNVAKEHKEVKPNPLPLPKPPKLIAAAWGVKKEL